MTANADSSTQRSPKVSERKVRANAENARHSTGPRSPSGKSASARNAEKHGAYSHGARAIGRGPFAEDQDELDAYLAEFLESAAPRDVLEREEVRRIALLSRRMRRVDRYEAEILGPPDNGVERKWTAADVGSLEDQIVVLHTFGKWAVEGIDDGVNFEHILARMLYDARISRLAGIPLPHEPDTEAEPSARARVEWHIQHVYDGPVAAVKWAIGLTFGLQNRIVKRDDAPYTAARTSLAATDKVSVITQRISRELDSAMRRYDVLQRRTLPEATTLRESEPRDDPT